MSERFDMSFRNIEVRVWCCVMLPSAIAGLLILWFASDRYYYMAALMPLIGWVIFYIWRFLHKKKIKAAENGQSSSAGRN